MRAENIIGAKVRARKNSSMAAGIKLSNVDEAVASTDVFPKLKT